METTQNKAARLGAAKCYTHNHYKQFGSFNKVSLPNPSDYFAQQDLKLIGSGEWKNAICPFHTDTKPSLRINVENGAYRCMACGARGGDVLAFHMHKHGLNFVEACKQLGAWAGGQND